MARIWNTPILIPATKYFGGRRLFFRHAARQHVDRKKETIRASESVGDVVATLPVARPFRRPGHSAGARQAFGGVFNRDRTFLRRGRYVHYRGGLEAYLCRAAVSVKSNETSIDPCVRVGISTLATHDRRRRIVGSVEVLETAGVRDKTTCSGPVVAIQEFRSRATYP